MTFTISYHLAGLASLAPYLSSSITAPTKPGPSSRQHQGTEGIGATAGTLFSHLLPEIFTGVAEQCPDPERHHGCGGEGHDVNPALPVPSSFSLPCT